eukprot:CAMPEP_0180614472 /NCGR_PEP_ID=MMETSP1037_2-20121125/31432_1 /TAXON_ID=632150 /ORGANISM="Azadinium spinosum, Strain 3D9" /LENGTH=71 /DNA_ID=CAMNT_0022634181 /DNA_START=996 /DNA_END=1209 /DNA_ORIENTATION=-
MMITTSRRTPSAKKGLGGTPKNMKKNKCQSSQAPPVVREQITLQQQTTCMQKPSPTSDNNAPVDLHNNSIW